MVTAGPTKVTREEFFGLVAPLYRQLQKWAMTETEKADHVGDYYDVLRGFKPLVIREAVEALLRSATTLPAPSVFLHACGEARRRLNAEYRATHPETEPDPLHCTCGCGGVRWALWLEERKVGRDYVACLSKRTNLPPKGRYVQDERGVPVFGMPEPTEQG